MSQNNVKKCPNTNTLTDYLLGQLEPPTLDECESHIADCDTCHETLRGLSADDTLSEHVADAFLQATESDSFSVDSDENDHVRGLVDRLLSQTGSRSLGPKPSSADTEVLADRAAEVLRCVTTPDDGQKTLGSIGDYQLMRLLGSGSTGVVFQAIDQKLDRTVALKVLRPSLGSVARERFIAEARLAASIEHPNVVTIYQVGQHDRLAFIAMQWLPGQTLEAKLHSTAAMADEDVRRISAQVAAGLQAAHQRQLVHRDIKPANVWISDDDEVKILDFGLARIVDDNPGLTATGMLAGTPNFMSPEQTKGHELDGRSDLFSLGCMMYRMATGKLAFGATSILGTLQAIQNEQPTPPKLVNVDISSDLSDLTMALLEKQPANRPESAEQVVTMLESARGQWPMKIAGYQSPQPASQKELKSQAKRRRFGGRWGAFIAASLLGLAGWNFAPQIIRIATDQGELVIESEDKGVEVQILQDGKVVRVLDTKTKNSFNIESGDYQIKAAGDGNSFEVTPNSLTMKRGQQTIVSVTKQPSTREPMAAIGKGFNTEQRTALDNMIQSGKLKDGMSGAIGPNGEGFILSSPSIDTDPKKINDDVVRDAPILKIYPMTTAPQLALNTLQMVLEGRDTVRMQQDANTGAIMVMGRKDDHQLASDALAKLDAAAGASAGNGRQEAQTRREQLNASQPTFKGKPFTHWINIVETERSTAMLCDALRAGAKLAETAEDKAKLLEVARTLARKHRTVPLNDDVDRNQYREALLVTMKTFEPKKVAKFVLTELEQGTPASIGFCSFLVNRYFYGGDTEATRARSDSLQQALVDRAPELLKRIVAGLERDETRAESYVLLNLEQMLTGMRSMWEGMGGSGGGGFTRSPDADFDQALVDQANKQNKESAPTIRQLFLDSSPATKAELIRLTRAFWQNDEQIELALQTAVLDSSTQLDSRRWMYQLITGEDGRGARTTRRDVLKSSPEPFAVLFLKKLLDNQLGPNAQRVKISDFEVVCNAQSGHPMDFVAELATTRDGGGRNRQGGVFGMNLEDTKTIEGRPAMVYQILNSLGNIVLTPKRFSSEELDVKTIKPLLVQILAIETSKDPELQADLESMKTLLIFKNTKTLLEKITKQPALSQSPKSSSSALYKGKPFTHWINIAATERSTEMLCDALLAGAELAATDEEKGKLLEVVRTLARKYGGAYSNKLKELTQHQEAMFKALNVLDPAEIIQFVLDELEHGTHQSVGFCSSLFKYNSKNERYSIAWSEAHDNAFVEQAPKLLQLIVAQIEGGGARASSSFSVLFKIMSTLIGTHGSQVSFAGGGKRAYVSGVTEKRVSWANEKNPTLAPTIRQLFLDSSAATKLHLVHLTRAFWPNDEEVELALQSSLLDPSTIVEVRDAFYRKIVGSNNRDSYWDFLESSPKPIAVQFLKKLLDNQLGPENQRVVVMDSSVDNIGTRGRGRVTAGPKVVEGRPATIYHMVKSLESLMQKHPNDTDEDVTAPIRELLERIVEIEDTDNPTLKQELNDFRELGIFNNAKKLLTASKGSEK